MKARRVFLFVFAAGLLAAFGCSGSSSDSAALHCSDGGAAAANAVNLSCGGAISGTTEKVDIVLGGPAAGTTMLSGFNFDVTYLPTRLEFAPSGTYTSPLFPNALILVSLFNGQPGRVVVSIRNTNGALVSVGAGQHEVLSLSFKRLPGIIFNPTPVTFENAEATDATAVINFTTGLSLSYN